jgi:hypothetical protein
MGGNAVMAIDVDAICKAKGMPGGYLGGVIGAQRNGICE